VYKSSNVILCGLCGVDDINSSVIFDDLSDHFPILVHLNIGCKIPNLTCKYYKRFYSAANFAKFDSEMDNDCWSDICDECISSRTGIQCDEIYIVNFY